MRVATCTYLLQDDYFVQMAKQVSKIIGFKGYGGKLKRGQTIRKNAVEEIWEETGGEEKFRIDKDVWGGIHVRPEWLEPVGRIDFYNGARVPFGKPSFRVYFFICRRYMGKAVDTIEMKDHQLFHIHHLPLERLVKGDPLYIPDMLTGKPREGWVRRTKDFSKIINYDLQTPKKPFDF
jgi:hypothetical protein